MHPELDHKILRPMVKESAQSDLWFSIESPKTVMFCPFLKNDKKSQFSGSQSKTVSPIEFIPSP